MPSGMLGSAAVLLVWNLIVWAVWRWDKAAAGRRARRVPERVLVGLAWLAGAPGALTAMYAHRARHKTRKGWMVGAVLLAAVVQGAGAVWALW